MSVICHPGEGGRECLVSHPVDGRALPAARSSKSGAVQVLRQAILPGSGKTFTPTHQWHLTPENLWEILEHTRLYTDCPGPIPAEVAEAGVGWPYLNKLEVRALGYQLRTFSC